MKELPHQSKTAILYDGRTVDYDPQGVVSESGTMIMHSTLDGTSTICFFKSKESAIEQLPRLKSLLGRYNPTLLQTAGGAACSQNEATYWRQLFNWPTLIVKPSYGLLYPLVPAHFFFSSGRFNGKEKEPGWFTSPKLSKLLPSAEVGDWLGRLNACRQMVRGIQYTHSAELTHSSLGSKDLYIDPTTGTCLFYRVVGFVVPGFSAPNIAGTPGYIAPELVKSMALHHQSSQGVVPSRSTDLHSMAVLLYELLLYRHPLRGPKVNSHKSTEEDDRLSMGEKALFIEHPQDDSNRPIKISNDSSQKYALKVTIEDLGPYLHKLFLRAFVDGLHEPKKRPSAMEWEEGLSRTQDLMIPCGNPECAEKWFVYKMDEQLCCPWCGWEYTTPLPFLEFQIRGMDGEWQDEGHGLMAWDKRTLHEWHVWTNSKPNERADLQDLAEIQLYQGQWIMVNRGLESMVSPSGNPVPKKQAVVLKDGDEILLSGEPNSRRVRVRIIQI